MNRKFLLTLAFVLASPATGFACTLEEMQVAKMNVAAAAGEIESALGVYLPPAQIFFDVQFFEDEIMAFHTRIMREVPHRRNHAAVRAYRKAMAEFNQCAKKRSETTMPPLPLKKPE